MIMKNQRAAKRIGFVAALLLTPMAAHAADSNKAWSLNLKAGVQYDSNVTVSQTDLTSGVGDTAGTLEASAGYKLIHSHSNELAIGYDFSQSLYTKLNKFDIQNHSVSLTGSTKVGSLTLGGSYYFYYLLLGGHSFLRMHMVAPSVSAFLRPNIYVRGYYYFFDKTFDTATARNATNQQPGVDVFYFFDHSKGFVTLGGHYEHESATGPEFDYHGYTLQTSVQLPLEALRHNSKLKFEYAYLQRFYPNITPSISARRREVRSTLRAIAEIPVINHLTFNLEYRYVDRHSNLPAANYTENVFGGSLSYKF